MRFYSNVGMCSHFNYIIENILNQPYPPVSSVIMQNNRASQELQSTVNSLYNEIRLYRTDNTGPFDFDIEGVDCMSKTSLENDIIIVNISHFNEHMMTNHIF